MNIFIFIQFIVHYSTFPPLKGRIYNAIIWFSLLFYPNENILWHNIFLSMTYFNFFFSFYGYHQRIIDILFAVFKLVIHKERHIFHYHQIHHNYQCVPLHSVVVDSYLHYYHYHSCQYYHFPDYFICEFNIFFLCFVAILFNNSPIAIKILDVDFIWSYDTASFSTLIALANISDTSTSSLSPSKQIFTQK